MPPVPFQLDRNSPVLQVFTHFQDVKAKKRPAETQLVDSSQIMDVDGENEQYPHDSAVGNIRLVPANHKILKRTIKVESSPFSPYFDGFPHR